MKERCEMYKKNQTIDEKSSNKSLFVSEDSERESDLLPFEDPDALLAYPYPEESKGEWIDISFIDTDRIIL